MSKLKTEKLLGKQISGKLMCPKGCYNGDQPLYTVGDMENNLFCPHCDFQFKIQITYMDGK